jgi:hypothetical protein
VRRILLVLTVALVMAVMAFAMAMPAFAQTPADPCGTGTTPASPPQEGAAPVTPPAQVPPGYEVRQPEPIQSRSRSP